MSRTLAVLTAALLAIGCSGKNETTATPPATGSTAAQTAPTDDQPPASQAGLSDELRELIEKPFTGDFEAMARRRLIRAAVPFNRTFYFIDNGAQRGMAYEYLKTFEDELNKKRNTGNVKIFVVPIPMRRDALFTALRDGKVDVVIAQLTVTPERQQMVDFTNPTRKNVSEVVVTGPGAPAVATAADLSGKEVFVRQSSSYFQSLEALNAQLVAQKKPPAIIEPVSESLEDDDLLEMVNAGLIPATVVDNYLADFWKQVFPKLVVHDDITLRTNGELAVAIRKNSPQIAAELNQFIGKFGIGTALGNILNKRYLESTKYVKNATSEAERKQFQTLANLFKRYGDRYQFDYLLMAAQAFQESGLNQNARSQVGAIGIMQLMPATGKEQKVGDIKQLEPNIHAGVKYMRFMRDEFFADEPMDDLNKALFTFASYNAGPGRIRQLRRETEKRGLNPNIWFGNVEQITSERIGRETVTYVSNIYKYYLAYRLVVDERVRKTEAKSAIGRGMR